MFNKLKQFKDLRDQAKTLQQALAGESVTVEKNGVKLTINGNLEVTDITIDPNTSINNLGNIMKELFNDGVKKTQKIMARKMQEMGGFPGLS